MLSKVLDFEAKPWKYSAEKELAIQDELGMKPTEYYLLLARALDTPQSFEHSPALVKRLVDIVERRVALRTGTS